MFIVDVFEDRTPTCEDILNMYNLTIAQIIE